jgi:hypothetical protein
MKPFRYFLCLMNLLLLGALAKAAPPAAGGSAVSAEEIVERLMITAARYRFPPSPNGLPGGYFIQFEHWHLGKLRQTQRTKRFALNAEDKNPSFFIAFPTNTHAAHVAPSGGDGEFRGNLVFATSDSAESTLEVLEDAELPPSQPGASVLLGYRLIGMAQSLPARHEATGEEIHPPLAANLEEYHKLLVEKKRDDVDVIVFRLIYE